MAALAEKLQVWGFEDGILIYKDFSLGSVLELQPRDINCSTDQELNLIHDVACDFLNALPDGLSIQFVQAIEKTAPKVFKGHAGDFDSSANDLVQALTDERLARLRGLNASGALPSQKLYVVIRKAMNRKPKEKRKSRIKFWRKNDRDADNVMTADQLEAELKLFRQVVAGVTQGLATLGSTARNLNEDETFALLFDQWNPGHPVAGLNFNREEIRDDLVLTDLVVSMRGLALAATHHRVVSLKIMPDQTFASMSERLCSLPFGSKLFLSVEVLNQSKEDLTLQTQRRIAYAMFAGKKGVSDLESEAKLRELDSLLEKRVTGSEKVFQVSLTVLLRHKDESVLDEQVAEVLQKVRELSGAEGMLESLAASSIFTELALPNARSKERSRRVNTSVLADFLPIFGDWKGHAVPRILLRNQSGGLIGFDPFSPELTNFNQIVSGGSGSGKSFLVNLLIAQAMKASPKVFILDIGGSYKKICENLGGQYIALGTGQDLSINPFDLSSQDPEAVDQKIKFLTSLVELMTKEDAASAIGKLERSEIEGMIQEILAEVSVPRLSDLRSKLLGSEEANLQKMGKILAPWCGDSPYGKFVDRETTLKLTSPIVCFDLKGLESKPDLQAVTLFLITDLIWREVQKDRTTEKFCIFDECWKTLESDAGASLIGNVFRTFRKYRASAIAISQTMDDFAKSKVASSILPNSSVKWILKQTGGNMPSLKEILLLNEREVDLVTSVTSKKGLYSEAFLIAGDAKQVVVVESTPLEYWLATTDPADIQAYEIEKLRSESVNDLEILNILATKFPQGMSQNINQNLEKR